MGYYFISHSLNRKENLRKFEKPLMGAYSGVGAYLSSSGTEMGAYSGGGVIREWGLNRSFMVFEHLQETRDYSLKEHEAVFLKKQKLIFSIAAGNDLLVFCFFLVKTCKEIT